MFYLEVIILTAFETFEMTISNDQEGIDELKRDLTINHKHYIGTFRNTKELRVHKPSLEKMRVFELIKIEEA